MLEIGSIPVDILTCGVQGTEVSQSKVYDTMSVLHLVSIFPEAMMGGVGEESFQKSCWKDVNICEEPCLVLFEVVSSSLWPFRCFVLCMRHSELTVKKVAARKGNVCGWQCMQKLIWTSR